MSWASTRDYYELINRAVQRKVAPEASAPLLIESLDFSALRAIEDDSGWDHAADVLSESARRLVDARDADLLERDGFGVHGRDADRRDEHARDGHEQAGERGPAH